MEATSHGILVLDLTEVPLIDSSAALALEESVKRASGRNQHALLVGAQPRVERVLHRLGVLSLFPEECKHETRLEAMRHAARLLRNSGDAGIETGTKAQGQVADK